MGLKEKLKQLLRYRMRVRSTGLAQCHKTILSLPQKRYPPRFTCSIIPDILPNQLILHAILNWDWPVTWKKGNSYLTVGGNLILNNFKIRPILEPFQRREPPQRIRWCTDLLVGYSSRQDHQRHPGSQDDLHRAHKRSRGNSSPHNTHPSLTFHTTTYTPLKRTSLGICIIPPTSDLSEMTRLCWCKYFVLGGVLCMLCMLWVLCAQKFWFLL